MAASLVRRVISLTRIREGIAELLADIGRPRVLNKRAAGSEVGIEDLAYATLSELPATTECQQCC
jgi:hypothetical protein